MLILLHREINIRNSLERQVCPPRAAPSSRSPSHGMLARGSLLRPGSGGAENTSQSTMGEALLSDLPTFVVPRSKHHQHLQAAVAAENNTPRRPGGIAPSPRSKRERPRIRPKQIRSQKSRKNLTPPTLPKINSPRGHPGAASHRRHSSFRRCN